MPIKLVSKSYTDIYGNSSSNYKANAGDLIASKLTISSDIYVRSTSQNQLSFDRLDSVFTQSQGDFLEQGFRAGQTFYWKDISDSNTIQNSFTGTIDKVEPLYLVLSGTLPNANNASSNGAIWVFYTDSTHDEINLQLNFTDSNNPTASANSLIDGEASKFAYQGLTALSVGSTANLTQIGKKSGQFEITNTTIKRLADSTNVYVTGRSVRNYEVSFSTIFVGVLFEDMFKGKSYLKQFSQLDFKVVSSETINPTTIAINDACDTGWFNEAYNTEIPKVLLTTSDANNLYYNAVNTITATIKVQGTTTTQVEIGAVYDTLDDTYNLNQAKDQSDKLHLLKTGLIDASDIASVFTSDGDYPYTITLTAFSYADAGGNRTFTLTFTLDPQYSTDLFGKFIEGRGDSDKQFYIWIKAENYNFLAFNGEMEYKYAVGVEITPLSTKVFNHYYNSDYSDLSVPPSCSDFNLEDDLGFVADFELVEADENSSVAVSVVVKNSSTDVEFTLDSVDFDISQQDLNYFAKQSVTLNNNLPQSSLKKVAYLMEKNALSGGSMNVRLYYPFLFKWEYWEDLVNTHPYFTSQGLSNNNWFNFQSSPWSVKLKVEITRNGTTDWFYKNVSFKTYDDSIITSTISLFEYPAMTSITNLKEDIQILVRAMHVASGGFSNDVYGQITIEAKESSPRWVMSTEIDTNTDANNPLYGITNNQLTTSGAGTTTVVFECLLDMTKVTAGNLCITSKISEERAVGGDLLIFTNGNGVLNTNSINFITA
jgi:hypothetical protein